MPRSFASCLVCGVTELVIVPTGFLFYWDLFMGFIYVIL